MAICPSCGNSKLFLKPHLCENCRKVGCDRCMGVFAHTYAAADGTPERHYFCSWACFETWVTGLIGRGLVLVRSGAGWYLGPYHLGAGGAERALKIQAHHYVLAERHEDAAQIYEMLGMWKEAGDVRRAGRRQTVMQVQVNLNDLIDQLKRMGLTASYTCPVCHSPFAITGTTKPEALARCQYCGAVIHPTELVEAVAKVVGYR